MVRDSLRWARPLVAVLFTAALMCGCDGRWRDLDPPTRTQLRCRPTSGSGEMVLVIDTGRRSAEVMSGETSIKGLVTITERAYRLQFPATPTAPPSAMTINRFDGQSQSDSGAPSPAGMRREAWRCASEKPGPRL